MSFNLLKNTTTYKRCNVHCSLISCIWFNILNGFRRISYVRGSSLKFRRHLFALQRICTHSMLAMQIRQCIYTAIYTFYDNLIGRVANTFTSHNLSYFPHLSGRQSPINIIYVLYIVLPEHIIHCAVQRVHVYV